MAFLCLTSLSQEIKGKIVDASDGQSIFGVNIMLFKSQDSIMLRGTVTEQSGNFKFYNIQKGSYRIQYSFVGYEDKIEIIELTASSLNLGEKKLSKSGAGMKEVVVVAKKPLYELKSDRMVINVKSSITSTGLTILDVLERSPGVLVNRQSNSIALLGKSGVRIMINGKVSNMPVNAIFQMLSGMNSANIEKIELITTPPSNLDAEGNAGYINIVMSKNSYEGTNGSITLGLGWKDKLLYNGSADFNHRKGKINLYGSYSYSSDPQVQNFDMLRDVSYQGKLTRFTTQNKRDAVQTNQFGRIGIDYELAPGTVIGALISGYDTKFEMDALSSVIKTSEGKPDTSFQTFNDELNHWNHNGINLNFSREFRNKNRLSFDFDKLHYYDDNPSNYISTGYDANGQMISTGKIGVTKATPIDMWIGKTDYIAKLSKKIEMEAGLKSTISRFDNNVGVSREQGSGWSNDTALSNNSNLHEVILAAYTSFSIQFSEKTTGRVGLRYEHTDSELDEVGGERLVDRNYGNFFPSASISHKINDNNTVNASYARRITRPTFNEMAPFVLFFDPYSFFGGNPSIQPSITDNFVVSHAYKSISTMLSYNNDKQAILFAQMKVDSVTGIAITTSDNIESIKTFSANISFPIKATTWWKMQNSITGLYQESRDEVDKKDYLFIAKSFQLSTTQSFTLKNNLTMEANLQYMSGGLWGRWVMDPLWTLNVGAKKKFGKAGTVSLNVNDVFMTNLFRLNASESAWSGSFYGRFQRRSFILSYTTTFGRNEVRAKRERQTGADSERRVQTN
ncbi:MAG TPA: TonB-dependent receptor [Chitinophagaceae bacterium]|nr:TonB-dependent receptor [Chitinophagaceae bacterium]